VINRRVAIIILSRNLPDRVENLVREFREHDTDASDIYVIEAGTDRERLSPHYTTWASSDEVMQEGLRLPRGFNLGLLELLRTGRFHDYDFFFLVRATVGLEGPVISRLLTQMSAHPRVGILSPCGATWEERALIGPDDLRYVWHINHYAWLVRRELVELVMEREDPSMINLLFDGTNFRGYGTDLELVTKGYINEYATALSTAAFLNEDPELLMSQADLIKTDPFGVNARIVFEEGFRWMRRKYGFRTRLQMQVYAEMWYERFFALNPSLEAYRLLSIGERRAR